MKKCSKKLQSLSNLKLSKGDLKNIKGGLRFVTYNQSEYTQTLSKLNVLGMSYSNGISTDAKGRTHYCIEW